MSICINFLISPPACLNSPALRLVGDRWKHLQVVFAMPAIETAKRQQTVRVDLCWIIGISEMMRAKKILNGFFYCICNIGSSVFVKALNFTRVFSH